MEDMHKCPSCGAETDSEQKFCSKCGTEVPSAASARPTCCPNPNCGQRLEGHEQFCPVCGTKIGAVAQESTQDQQSQITPLQVQRQMWFAAAKYLEENPEGEHSSSAIIIAECAKTSMAIGYAAPSTDDPVNYSLLDNDVNSARGKVDILGWEVETIPKTVEIPKQVGKLYIHPSFDTDAFREMVSSKLLGVQLDPVSLKKERNEIIWAALVAGAEVLLNKIIEQAKAKYESYLVDGRTKAVTEKVTLEELTNEVEIYYKAYTEKKLGKAQRGFERLASYDPFTTYNHKVLYDIYLQQKEYKRAVEEAMYAAFLEDMFMEPETRKAESRDKIKRDIQAILTGASVIRMLGLSPGLLNYLEDINIEDEFSEESESSDSHTQWMYLELLYHKQLAGIVTNAIANQEIIRSKLQQANR